MQDKSGESRNIGVVKDITEGESYLGCLSRLVGYLGLKRNCKCFNEMEL